MIGHLRGKLAAKHPPLLLVDVGGVGYEVEAPMSTFYGLPGLGAEVSLHTHLVVREDAHVLFGFGTERERSLFRELIKVSGVGPRIALGILSGVDGGRVSPQRRVAGRRSADAHSRASAARRPSA